MLAETIVEEITVRGHRFIIKNLKGNIEGARPDYIVTNPGGGWHWPIKRLKEARPICRRYIKGKLPIRYVAEMVKIIQEEWPGCQVVWAMSGTAYIRVIGKIVRVSNHDVNPKRETVRADVYLFAKLFTKIEILALIKG